MKNSSVRWACALVTCLFAIGWIAWSRRPSPAPPAITPFESATATIDHGYVGWEVCSECHEKMVDEFRQTRHLLALRRPDQVTFSHAQLADTNSFHPFGANVRFDFSASTAAATLTTTSVNEASPPAVSQIEFVYGAGARTDEVYFTRRGAGLFELPAVWMSQQQRWGASLFDPHGSGDYSRPLTPQCLECHNTWVDYHAGTLNEYGPLQSHLLGVTCERCHGPAKNHVEHHHSPKDDSIKDTIVQPKRLSRDRLMDLCAQCHTNSVRYRQPPFTFRPGDKLEDCYRVLEMRYPEEDRVANQVRYLKESRCYQQSEQLTCVTCHDPHRKHEADSRAASAENCHKCHPKSSCRAALRLPVPLQDRCVDCHMPLRNKIQVNFVTDENDIVVPATRSEHRIGVYADKEWELLFEWYGTQTDDQSKARRIELGLKLVEHWESVAKAAEADHRFLKAIDGYRHALRFGESTSRKEALDNVIKQHHRTNELWFQGVHLKSQRHLEDAIGTFETLLTIQPNLAKAHFELGSLLAATGRLEDAVEHLKTAAEYDLNDPAPHAMQGWLEFLANRPEMALEHYHRASEIEPWSDDIEFMSAQCAIKLGRWENAVEFLERTVEINPKHRQASQALRSILRERFTATEALPKVLRAVELTKAQQADLLLALVEIYRDLQRIPEAEQALATAGKVAGQLQPDLVPQVQLLKRRLHSP